MHRSRKHRCCLNPDCRLRGIMGAGNIARHGFLHTKNGKRRRWCCKVCDKTSSTNTGTPYHRIHSPRHTFDDVVSLSVEGLNKSAIARVTGLCWNTVARWLERAGAAARQFTDKKLKGFELIELQRSGDETIKKPGAGWGPQTSLAAARHG